ncbi:MAG: PadR family transcriptional regulator [Cellulomonadaceae bacterium]|nr:PadR family transcriptional regulator [Cellulomonadaceae bacterium]
MKLRHVLLGLVELHPGVTGYELKAIVAQSTGYFFSASLSQIYPALKELTEQGAVTFTVAELVGKQDRKMYTITPAGRDELAHVLAHPEPLPRSLSAFREFLLHLTFIGHLDDAAVDRFVAGQLEHFRGERVRVADDHLEIEREFLHLDGPTRDRYWRIWRAEYEFLVDDLDRKIAWMEALLADRAGTGGH